MIVKIAKRFINRSNLINKTIGNLIEGLQLLEKMIKNLEERVDTAEETYNALYLMLNFSADTVYAQANVIKSLEDRIIALENKSSIQA